MSEDTAISQQRRGLAVHVLSLRKWEKNFLLLGVFIAVAGAAIRGHAYLTSDTVDTITNRLSPSAMRIGFSIVLGFFLGWALRSALRVALSFAIVLVLIWWGLSYMGWADSNVDLFSFGKSVKEASGWVEGYADHAATFVKAYIPSAFGGTVGMLVGFRRR